MGKYKVRLLPRISTSWKPHSRVFEVLETFPCDAIQMMMNPGEQYMTSTRYLQLKRSSSFDSSCRVGTDNNKFDKK
jgi:hypothetical protein